MLKGIGIGLPCRWDVQMGGGWDEWDVGGKWGGMGLFAEIVRHIRAAWGQKAILLPLPTVDP